MATGRLEGLTRRAALRRALGATAFASLRLPAWADAGGDWVSLGAVVDCMLPEDALTPAATSLGVDREIIEFAATVDGLPQLLSAGLAWLDQAGGKLFRELPLMRQTALLQQAEAWDYNQIPGRFYHLLRALAVEFYYARAEAIAGLPLNPAPQPFGYPPPWS